TNGDNVSHITFAQRPKRGLHHANVTLHSAQQHGVAVAWHTLKHRAEHITSKAGEHLFIDRFRIGEQGSDLRHGTTQSLGILRRHDGRNVHYPSQPDQQLRVSYQLFLLENRRQELLLDIDDDKGTVVSFEGLAAHFL